MTQVLTVQKAWSTPPTPRLGVLVVPVPDVDAGDGATTYRVSAALPDLADFLAANPPLGAGTVGATLEGARRANVVGAWALNHQPTATQFGDVNLDAV